MSTSRWPASLRTPVPAAEAAAQAGAGRAARPVRSARRPRRDWLIGSGGSPLRESTRSHRSSSPAPNVIVVGVGTKHETEILHTDAFDIVMQPKRPGAFGGRR